MVELTQTFNWNVGHNVTVTTADSYFGSSKAATLVKLLSYANPLVYGLAGLAWTDMTIKANGSSRDQGFAGFQVGAGADRAVPQLPHRPRGPRRRESAPVPGSPGKSRAQQDEPHARSVDGRDPDLVDFEGNGVLGIRSQHRRRNRFTEFESSLRLAAAGGDVLLQGARFDHLAALIKFLRDAGVTVEVLGPGLRIRRNGGRLAPVDFSTEPYPGFPTDLQAQAMALMCMADGQSRIKETIFENRFMHAPELARLGAQIAVHGNEAVVTGVPKLIGAPVMATDLRASASLILAGLVADGDTVIDRIYHLDRGYERIEEKLSALGAKIRRID